MVLGQRDEAQIAEFFRLVCARGGLGHAAATHTTPEEAHEYWPSGVFVYGNF
jgi:hypothetical protein